MCVLAVFSTAVIVAQEASEPAAEPVEPRPETNLTVGQVLDDFDAAWGNVAANFYDPEFSGINWDTALASERSKVADAADAIEAYQILKDSIDGLESLVTGILPPWDVPPQDDSEPGEVLLEYGGVGILLSQTTAGEILALQVFRETPAERSGVLIGDIIVGVDDWRVEGEDAMEAVVSRVRGIVDTVVNLTLRDPDGVERILAVTRAQIDLRASVETRVLDNGTGYIRIPALTTELVEQASRSLPNLLSTRNLILDLRGISSGGIESMTTLAQWFLGAANVGGFLTQGGPQALPFRTDAVAVYQRPMTVLTDGGTSGIPEMLAALLRSYDRAGIVGGQTSGGFEFGRVESLPNGGLVGDPTLITEVIRVKGVGKRKSRIGRTGR